MINVFAMAFNDSLDNRTVSFILFPRKPTLANFAEVFKKYDILRAYGITIFRTVIGAGLSVLLNAMYAYALRKHDLIGRKWIMWFTVIPMYFGAGLIPFYTVLRALSLTNTVWVYILPYAIAPFYIIVYRTFFAGVPDSIEESARLDGAGVFRSFFSIMLPLSLPVVATIALFAAVSQWNDWFVGNTFVFSDKLWPMQTLLRYILNISQTKELSSSLDTAAIISSGGSMIAAESIKMSMIVLTVVPILCVYPFLQRYFVTGIAVGSLKE
ncbi:maltose ABC transporter permease [Clostridia bacterium]|nr:maltose ABC transporter permease [Clostridia bacterium]